MLTKAAKRFDTQDAAEKFVVEHGLDYKVCWDGSGFYHFDKPLPGKGYYLFRVEDAGTGNPEDDRMFYYEENNN